MTNSNVLLAAVGAIIVSLAALGIAVWRSARMPAFESREQALLRRIRELEDALLKAEAERQRQTDSLRNSISLLQEMLLDKQQQIEKLTERVRQLEQPNSQKPARVRKPALVVALGNGKMLEEDLAKLRGARTFQLVVLRDAKMAEFEALLNERRAGGNPVKYAHLAMHAGPDGVGFVNGMADGLWLSEQLKDCQVLVIAGCKATKVANLLAVVPVVIAMRDDIDNEHASTFSLAFWTAVGQGADPEDAFDEAIGRSPARVSEMAEIYVRP